MTCRKITYEQLTAQAAKSHKLEPIGQMLVEAGLVTQAELEIAKALKQRYFSPRRRRFANVQLRPTNGVDVVWFEPNTLSCPTRRGGRKGHHD